MGDNDNPERVSAHGAIYPYAPVPRAEIERLGPAGIRVFLRICDHLGLTQVQRLALLGVDASGEIPTAGNLTEDQFYRLSYLIGIWKDLGAFKGSAEAISRDLLAQRTRSPYLGRNSVEYMIAEGLPAFHHVRRSASYRALNAW